MCEGLYKYIPRLNVGDKLYIDELKKTTYSQNKLKITYKLNTTVYNLSGIIWTMKITKRANFTHIIIIMCVQHYRV